MAPIVTLLIMVLMIRLILVRLLRSAAVAMCVRVVLWVLVLSPLCRIVPLSDPASALIVCRMSELSWVIRTISKLVPVKILITLAVTALELMMLIELIGCAVILAVLELFVLVLVMTLGERGLVHAQKLWLAPWFPSLVAITRPRTGSGVRSWLWFRPHTELRTLQVALSLTRLSSVSGFTGQL